jgi:solute carrier family 13 (sodium-dependent dicarboxylate transporter), member 2/3/5
MPRSDAGSRHATLSLTGAVVAAMASYWLTRGVLDEMPARALAIFVFAAASWATEALPLFATAFVVIGLEILFLASAGGLAEPATALLRTIGVTVHGTPPAEPIRADEFLRPFASDIIILFLGGLLLAAAVTKHGLDVLLASRVLTPFTRSPLRLLYGVMGITAFFSMWISNTATAAMMVALVLPLLRRLPEQEPFRLAVLLGVAFGANVGGIGTPIGTPPNAIAYGALNRAGYEITFLEWMVVTVPLEILLIAGIGLLLYGMLRPPPGLRLEAPPPAGPLSAAGRITLVVIAATVLLWITSGIHGLTPGAVALLAAAALTAIGVLDQRDVNTIDWNILILMWGALSLSVAVERSGLGAEVARFDLSVLPGGNWAPPIVVAGLAMTLSTFMSNTAAAALLVPMVLALPVADNEQLAILAALACSFAMAMPVSTPPNAIAYGTGAIPLRTMVRAGTVASVTAVALMLLGYRILLPHLFR